MKKQVTLSLELAKTMFETGGVARQFALENFSQEELTKKDLPKTWEELGKVSGCFIRIDSQICSANCITVCDNKNVFPTKKLAEAALALSQLLQLRDRYNGDWKPDWREGNGESKYIIEFYKNTIDKDNYKTVQRVLHFRTKELRDEFFKNFKDLIQIAKPLL